MICLYKAILTAINHSISLQVLTNELAFDGYIPKGNIYISFIALTLEGPL